jgi:hypothetical protein
MKYTILLVLLSLAQPVFAQTGISQGTAQLGGSVVLDFTSVSAEGQSQSGATIGLSPSFGYFVANNFEIYLSGNLTVAFGDLYEGSSKSVGAGLGARYLFPIGASELYLGLVFGIDVSIPDQGDNLVGFSFGIPLGFLIHLNPNVALDIGTRIRYMSASSGGVSADILDIPLGWFGVDMFF